jgi:hypothetical protein
MPLSFMNPALLFGALASALPVIIHFLSRRRVRRRMFSDLRFLDEVQARQARSLGIRRWLLLALRVLAILLVALAAAGPRWGGIGPVGGTRSVLMVLDVSASMNTQLGEGTRLTAAVAAAGDMIAALPGEAAVQVLVAGSRTRPLFGDWLPAGAGARRALDRVRPTDGAFDLAAVLREAGRQVARAPGSPVEVVLLSDLQDAGFPADPTAAAERLLAAGEARFLLRQVGRTENGGGITGLELPRRALRPGEGVTVRARVIAERADQVFALELDGAPVAEAVAEGAAGPAVLDFSLTVPPAGDHRGLIRKESDAFPGDDTRPFILSVPPAVRVLLVHGEDRPGEPAAGRGGWRYLAEALAPGRGPSPFEVRAVPGGRLTTGDFGTADVVALVDPGPLGRRTLEGFAAWLREGGAALVLAGDPGLAAYLRDSLLPVLGLEGVTEFRTAAPPGQRLRLVDPAHPVFAGLDPEALATLTEVPWRRWFAVTDPPGSALMVFAGGDPGFLTGTVGEGRYGLLPFNLAADGGDLAESPMALPFLQRTVSWLAAHAGAGRTGNLVVGNEAVMSPRDDAAGVLERPEDLVLDGPEAAPGPAAVQLEWRSGSARLRGGVLDHAGFYTFRAGPDTLGQLAAAIPGAESVPTLLSPDAMAERLGELGLEVAGDLTGTLPAAFLAALGGRNLAPWFLALAVILLLVETAVGRGSGRLA